MILDIQVITEDGELVDIEMQNSIFSKELYHRLQAYEARMIDHQSIVEMKDTVTIFIK